MPPYFFGLPMRTHFCGLIDEALTGQSVTLCGWTDVARNLGPARGGERTPFLSLNRSKRAMVL